MNYGIITDEIIDEMLDDLLMIKLNSYFGEFSYND